MTYQKVVKIIATTLVLGQGLYYSMTQPGRMDLFNGIMGGFVIYSIWRRDEQV
jgi:hypothetical protein